MAKRNRSAADSDTRASENHTPSSPTRPPVCCIYCSRESHPEKLLVTNWATWEGAASFLEALIEDQEGEPKWLKHKQGRWTQLVWPSGLTVTCRDDKLLEKLSTATTSWSLPEPYLSQIRAFLGDGAIIGADHERRPKERGGDPAAPKTPRVKADKAPSKSSTRPVGFVHIADLVPDVKPPHARQALRSLQWEKPDYGWWFAPTDADRVSKAIKGALK